MSHRPSSSIASAVLVVLPGLSSTVPASSAHDRVSCERPAPLFENPLAASKTRVSSAYPNITQWYEHEPEGAEATYELTPIVGQTELVVLEDCQTAALCERDPVGPGAQASCEVDGSRHLIGVTGTQTPHRSLGVTFALRASEPSPRQLGSCLVSDTSCLSLHVTVMRRPSPPRRTAGRP